MVLERSWRRRLERWMIVLKVCLGILIRGMLAQKLVTGRKDKTPLEEVKNLLERLVRMTDTCHQRTQSIPDTKSQHTPPSRDSCEPQRCQASRKLPTFRNERHRLHCQWRNSRNTNSCGTHELVRQFA